MKSTEANAMVFSFGRTRVQTMARIIGILVLASLAFINNSVAQDDSEFFFVNPIGSLEDRTGGLTQITYHFAHEITNDPGFLDPIYFSSNSARNLIGMASQTCLDRLDNAVQELRNRYDSASIPIRIEVRPSIQDGHLRRMLVKVERGQQLDAVYRYYDLQNDQLCNRIGPKYLVSEVGGLLTESSESSDIDGRESNPIHEQ